MYKLVIFWNLMKYEGEQMQNYVKKVEISPAYTKFAVAMETSETQLTFQNFRKR